MASRQFLVVQANDLLALPRLSRLLQLRRTTSFLTRPFSAAFSQRGPIASSRTVDSNEVDHFNALASTWWDPQGPSRLLHLMNPLRHSFISSCLASQSDAVPADRKLNYLDVGCGGGIFAESAARLPGTGSVTGTDPSTDVLEVAKAHARKDPFLIASHNRGQPDGWRLRYLNLGVEDLPMPEADGGSGAAAAQYNSYPPESGYDIITLFEVLEHVPYPSEFLSSILPHLRPGGWIILSTIARTWTSWLTTKVMAEDVLRIVPQGTHDWGKYVNEQEVRDWFAKLSDNGRGRWTNARAMGVIYIPGLGWREVRRGEEWGNYFFGVRKPLE